MNFVFIFLIFFGLITALIKGDISTLTNASLTSMNQAVELIIYFIGMMCLWLGIGKVAERSGFLAAITKLMQPFIRLLFPSIPKNHPALGAILMNMNANLFGFGSAATPFGLKAMEELQKLNYKKDTATDAMCTFLAINTACITLVPVTIIAIRVENCSANPAEIVGTTLFANTSSFLAALVLDVIFRQLSKRRTRR
jgi:spore maturation protein A